MNLHLMPDSFYTKKFIEFINKYFNYEQHYFLIVTNQKKLKYLDVDDYKRVEIINVGKGVKKLYSLPNKLIKKHINNSSKVFFHQLTNWNAYIINKYCLNQKLYWVLWGGDLYGHIQIQLYDKSTLEIIKNNRGILSSLKSELLIKPMREKAIQKLDYIATSVSDDYSVVIKNYNTSAKQIDFLYPNPVQFDALDAVDLIHKKNNEKIRWKNKYSKLVLLGNSGDPSNNHISILNILKKMKKSNFAIILPLSYGNSDYIKKLIDYGSKCFGEKFIPLTDFLQSEDYFSILKQVDVAIMNHNRQQGVGNIIPLIYLGKKVYIKEEVSTYNFFKKMGVQIEKTDNLHQGTIHNLFDSYSDEVVNKNKKIIKEKFSEKETLNYMKKIFV